MALPLTLPPTTPLRTMEQEDFDIAMAAEIAWRATNINELNVELPLVSTNAAAAATSAGEAAASAATAEQSEALALGAANYVGLWTALTGALNIPASTYHLGQFWVLTENVADVTTKAPGTATEWVQAGVAIGNRVLLSTVTAAAAATVDIETTIDDTYDEYVISFVGMTSSVDGSQINLRYKQSGAYVTTSTYDFLANVSLSSTTANTIATSGGTGTSILLMTALGNAADESASGEITLSLPASTTLRKTIRAEGTKISSAGTVGTIEAFGANSGTAAVTGIRIFPNSGTISGTFKLYGIKK